MWVNKCCNAYHSRILLIVPFFESTPAESNHSFSALKRQPLRSSGALCYYGKIWYPQMVPVKVSRDIGIRFPNLPGFSSNTVRRDAQLIASTVNTGSAASSSPTTAAIT
ncbi:hypothetical protein Tcan_14977 [Toxocara canis]|uniref:Uncharacterized protein n=1 Tax=Toxocara canis TaxID=6265 RepID=A0A0B2W3R4_TOXCA|nr:hypothetical protein Tcan_14977 [Toxocara canis]